MTTTPSSLRVRTTPSIVGSRMPASLTRDAPSQPNLKSASFRFDSRIRNRRSLDLPSVRAKSFWTMKLLSGAGSPRRQYRQIPRPKAPTLSKRSRKLVKCDPLRLHFGKYKARSAPRAKSSTNLKVACADDRARTRWLDPRRRVAYGWPARVNGRRAFDGSCNL